MTDDRNRDPYLEELLTEVIEPYIGLLPEAELQMLLDHLRATVQDDPELRRLHQAARPRTAPVRTGDVVRPGEDRLLRSIQRRKGGAA